MRLYKSVHTANQNNQNSIDSSQNNGEGELFEYKRNIRTICSVYGEIGDDRTQRMSLNFLYTMKKNNKNTISQYTEKSFF
jgi:hypothetical protein